MDFDFSEYIEYGQHKNEIMESLGKAMGVEFSHYNGIKILHQPNGFLVFNCLYGTLSEAKAAIDESYVHLKKSLK